MKRSCEVAPNFEIRDAMKRQVVLMRTLRIIYERQCDYLERAFNILKAWKRREQ
jgi:hypothetical protein